MDTIEMLIIIGAAIIVGFLMTGFISGWDYSNLQKMVKSRMQPDDQSALRVDADEFAAKLALFVDDCRTQGMIPLKAYYVEGSGNLNKSSIFARYTMLGWCDTVQSGENGCGSREDIAMNEIGLPRVVGLKCNAGITEVT